jgi:hypothetical protein
MCGDESKVSMRWWRAEAGQVRTWGRCDERRQMVNDNRQRGWPGRVTVLDKDAGLTPNPGRVAGHDS